MKAHVLLMAIVTGCQVDNPPRQDLSVHPADLAVMPDMSLGIIVATIAGAGHLFVADTGNNRIRQISGVPQ